MNMTDIEQMDAQQLVGWLKDRVQDFGSDETSVFVKQKLRGQRFLKLSKEDLLSDGISRGVAIDLIEIIQSYTSTSRQYPFVVNIDTLIPSTKTRI